ncbi:hypothetical protein [Corynebacterium doosanense]|uniref:Uncharacterized protein n=1 Tax=Corynebacterium doosanense CAU 212 = DSM 45436 TaxID=558173 RepID=A0A097IJP3_9CORY|nr:hypothetical protein [Corynebacterium doosanense]AIT62323.1 hypothetical protein CDOO_11445 [Corynebacterium doosanense CAU 212 = DSM 45436]
MTDYDEAAALKASDIRPTSATCNLSAFENSALGIEPGMKFELNIECEPDENGEPVEVTADWVAFPGRSWKEMEKIQVEGEECFLEAGSPELSIYCDYTHFRMGQLTLRVGPLEDGHVQAHLEATEDVDGLGLDSFSLDVRARFLGVYGSGSVSDLIDLEGLESSGNGHWVPVYDAFRDSENR